MTKYIRNDEGGIHSVEDDFALPAQGWSFIKEDEARTEHPNLFGSKVEAVKPSKS